MGVLRILVPILGVVFALSPHGPSTTTAQDINYFGAAFSPYVKNPPFPNWDSYTLDEIKEMLRIVLTKHNSISTYSMGVAGT